MVTCFLGPEAAASMMIAPKVPRSSARFVGAHDDSSAQRAGGGAMSSPALAPAPLGEWPTSS
jgi:hypothetical protein